MSRPVSINYSISREVIKKHLNLLNVAEDLSYIIDKYTDKRYIYSLYYTIECRYDDNEHFEFVAIAKDIYEFLDIFFALFDINNIEHFLNEDTYLNILKSIKKVSEKSFNCERPILLYSIYTRTLDECHWKYFRDGYRKGEDLEDNNFSYYSHNSELKKCPLYWLYFISENETYCKEDYVSNSLFIKYKIQSKKYLEELEKIVNE
jgi:hypothetical protein